MQVSNVLHMTRWKYRTQKWRKKSPSAHHHTTLSGYIFATNAWPVLTIGKKLAKQQYLPHMSSQYGKLWPTNGWDPFGSFGHRSRFQRFRVLAALLHGTLVVGVSQTLQRWTEGATHIRQGAITLGIDPHSSFVYKLETVNRYNFGINYLWHWSKD